MIKKALVIFGFFLMTVKLMASSFPYELNLTTIPGTSNRVMICLHGMGGNYRLANLIKKNVPCMTDSLMSFNFPDHGIYESFDPEKTSFGTAQEILPALYVLKKVIIDEGNEAVDLYGLSAGGGAVINILATLNTSKYEKELEGIGLKAAEKRKILDVLSKGTILLDTPLKSLKEIYEYRGPIKELEVIMQRYVNNGMEPLDALNDLEGLNMNFLVFFQYPDEILSNNKDAAFIARLQKVNAGGTTIVITSNDGSHGSFHPTLWKFYCSSFSK